MPVSGGPSPLPNPQPIGINDGGPRPVSDPRISPPQPLPPGVTPVQPPTLKPVNPQPYPVAAQPGIDQGGQPAPMQGLRSPEMGGGGTMSLLDLLRVRQNQQAWSPGPMMRQAY